MVRPPHLRSSALFFAAALFFFLSAPRASVAQNAATAAAPVARAASNPHALKLGLAGIPNAGNVDGVLFRGAQPHHDGYQQLKNLGVNIVVDLHNTGSGQSDERREVETLGMRYVSMPASNIYGPTSDQVAQFLKLVRDNPDKKIFVHCNLGADRTGVMVATYRMVQQQWSPDQAYNEMREFHFHRFLTPMGRYVKFFPERFAQEPAFTLLRSPAPATPAK